LGQNVQPAIVGAAVGPTIITGRSVSLPAEKVGFWEDDSVATTVAEIARTVGLTEGSIVSPGKPQRAASCSSTVSVSKPSEHPHLYPGKSVASGAVSTQNALDGQGLPTMHSFTSEHLQPSPVYPCLHKHATHPKSVLNESGVLGIAATQLDFLGQNVQPAIEDVDVGSTSPITKFPLNPASKRRLCAEIYFIISLIQIKVFEYYIQEDAINVRSKR